MTDPYGNVVFKNFLGSDQGRLTLTASGTYTVLVEGFANSGPGNYSFNVAPVTDTTQALTLGTTVNATLAAPGQQDRYTFTLAADALLSFDARTNNAGLIWSLKGPAGTAVNNLSFVGSDGGAGGSKPALPSPAGSYTLTVSATGQTTGAYAFRLSNLASVTLLTPGTPVSGTLSPANSTDAYRFDAAAGQSFYFARLSGTTSNASWRLIDPYGNVLFSTSLQSDGGRVTVRATGTYSLLVEGAISDSGTVNYSFNVAPITDTTQPLAVGSTVNATLAAPAQQDHYTFTLPANAQLYFDALTNSGGFLWSLAGPGGFSWFGGRTRRQVRVFLDRLAVFARQFVKGATEGAVRG